MATANKAEYVGLGQLMKAQAEEATQREAEKVKVDSIQVIGLELDDERFVVDILNVREIVRFAELDITRVPHAHPFVLGVVNLRGKVVPMIDLGQRIGLDSLPKGNEARAIVVELKERLLGFTVDAVSEVLRLPKDQIQPSTSSEEYVLGVVMVGEQIMSLLDLEKLLLEPGA